MTTSSATIVQRLWNYCNVLRDDGMSYGDYVEQQTYLLFLKMADEQVRVLGKHSAIADDYSWQSLVPVDGDALEVHYRTIRAELGKGSGLIPVIFRKAQNKIQDPAKLRRLIDLINGETCRPGRAGDRDRARSPGRPGAVRRDCRGSGGRSRPRRSSGTVR